MRIRTNLYWPRGWMPTVPVYSNMSVALYSDGEVEIRTDQEDRWTAYRLVFHCSA